MRNLFTICRSSRAHTARVGLALLSMCILSAPSFAAGKTEPLVWKLEQTSGVIGPHSIEFNRNGYCIIDGDTNTRIFGDEHSGQIFYANPKSRLYCELKQDNIYIVQYHLINISVGTFQE